MADTAVAITAGTGTNIDTRTEATNGNHRQVVVIGDPATNAGVAPVDATTGLAVNVTNASLTVASHAVTNAGTFAVQNTAATPAGTNNIGDVDVLTINGVAPAFGAGASGATVQRVVVSSDQLDPTVAHDAVDSGTPYKQGGRAVAGMSGITLVAAADRTDSLHGIDGAQYVRPHCGLEDIVSGRATDTAGTSTSCIASSGAGVKTYLTSVALCNSSATPVTVNLLDGASVKYTLSVPAGSGNNKEFTIPLPGTAATAWNFQSSAAATTITCSMIGFKSKV